MASKHTPKAHLPTYECLDCGQQVRTETKPNMCEHCGGDMRDLSGMKE